MLNPLEGLYRLWDWTGGGYEEEDSSTEDKELFEHYCTCGCEGRFHEFVSPSPCCVCDCKSYQRDQA